MMLVHVYSETPTYGAMMRPATSSMTSVQKLATKATVLATQDLASHGSTWRR